jgi:hypothetical protein
MINAKKIQNFTRKVYKNAKPILKLPIIWLEINLEFNSKNPSQMIGNCENSFAFLNTVLVNFFLHTDHCRSFLFMIFWKISKNQLPKQNSFVGPTLCYSADDSGTYLQGPQ